MSILFQTQLKIIDVSHRVIKQVFQTHNLLTTATRVQRDVPEDIAALPDLMGFGNMHDLRQAMVHDKSDTLRGLVEQYAAETTDRKSVV